MRPAESARSSCAAGSARSAQGIGRAALVAPDNARSASSAAISRWSRGPAGARNRVGSMERKRARLAPRPLQTAFDLKRSENVAHAQRDALRILTLHDREVVPAEAATRFVLRRDLRRLSEA